MKDKERTYTMKHGLTCNPAALASSRWRLSNERNRLAPASIAAATCSVSADRLPIRSAWSALRCSTSFC